MNNRYVVRTKALAWGIVAVLLAGAVSANASVLLNGSFESKILPGDGFYQYQGSPDGWSGGDYWVRGAVGFGWPAPQDGYQYEILASGGVMATTFNLAASGTYNLSWYDNSYSLQTQPYTISVYFNNWGGLVQSITDTSSSDWHFRSVSVQLDAGPNTLWFFNNNNYGNFYCTLDNVSLDAAPIPEASPITAGALLLGLVSAEIFRQRRRKTAERLAGT